MGALARHSREYLQQHGVSTAAVLAQRSGVVHEWLQKNRLPFTVLIDSSRDTLRAYGVWHRIGIDAWNIARPALFLIRQDRSIARSFVARRQTEFPSHEEILSWLGDM